MNNLFDPNSPLGASFNNIFGQGASAKPQDPPAATAIKSNPPVARMGLARPVQKPGTSR